MSSSQPASPSVYGGLFFVTLATIMYEIALTRIFSVTMWYHFAFVAISVAMFGMTVGALVVYLRPRWFPADRLADGLGLCALLFGVTIVLSLMTQLIVPFAPGASLTGLYSVVFFYVVVAVPFVFSGVCVTLALTPGPGYYGKVLCARNDQLPSSVRSMSCRTSPHPEFTPRKVSDYPLPLIVCKIT